MLATELRRDGIGREVGLINGSAVCCPRKVLRFILTRELRAKSAEWKDDLANLVQLAQSQSNNG
jgi:hypothetical protein